MFKSTLLILQRVSDGGPGSPVQPPAVSSTHHQMTTLTIDDSPLGKHALDYLYVGALYLGH